MRKRLLLLLLVCVATLAQSQSVKVTGRITNAFHEPVAYVSVQVKELQSGTVSKEDGTYTLFIEEGKYDIHYSIVGYKTQSITLAITKDYRQDIILENDAAFLQNVTIRTNYIDPAAEVIRSVIRRKDSLQAAIGSWSAKLYIKAVQQDSITSRRKTKSNKDSSIQPNKEIAGMAMTEILLKLDYLAEQKIREERIGVKSFGSSNDLFYLSATEGFFNFYNNLVKVPGLSPAQFLSPISYSGLLAYKFKTIKTQKKGSFKTYTISVKPRTISNATVEGELTISDSSWTIEHTRFRFPKFHLPQYDFFEVEQWYSFTGNAPMLSKQLFTYHSKSLHSKLSGTTTVTYSDYELKKQFPKDYFGVEVSATTEEAYKRDSTFWGEARQEPLTSKEIKFIHYKDSVYRVTHTKKYLDSIDYLTNKFTWKKLLLDGQTFYDRSLERTWQLPALPGLFQPLQFGGVRISPSIYYHKKYPSRKDISVSANLSYGLRNRDINGSLRLSRKYNPFNRGFYGISLSRDFEFIFQGDAWINMLKRSNLYLNNALGINHGVEITNGLFLYTDLDLALRRSLKGYKTGNTIDSLFSNSFSNNNPIVFEPYNALYGKLRLEYTHRQRYIREPKEKIILGSKWPTFYTTWRKGVSGIFNSRVDFDYWDIGIRQDINLGSLGILHYSVVTGSFLNTRDLKLIDYQWQRKGDPLLFANPNNAFQALDSSFPVFKRFYQSHIVHEFNGSIINKVPLLKKLQLREVAGAGFLVLPERNLRYAETFAGIERVFKWPFNVSSKFKLGVYVVGSVANQFTNPLTLKIGVTAWDKIRNRWY